MRQRSFFYKLRNRNSIWVSHKLLFMHCSWCVVRRKINRWKYSLNESVSLGFIFVLLPFLVDTHAASTPADADADAGIGGIRPLWWWCFWNRNSCECYFSYCASLSLSLSSSKCLWNFFAPYATPHHTLRTWTQQSNSDNGEGLRATAQVCMLYAEWHSLLFRIFKHWVAGVVVVVLSVQKATAMWHGEQER